MILEIFILLLAVIGFLCWYGYYTKIRMFAIVGMSILFLLSAWIILYNYTGKDSYGLQYRNGTTITEQNSTVTIITYNYTTYSDQTTFWVGFLLAIISIGGVFLVYANEYMS